ncbi:MAG: SURF1 family cytochrome oxidase biogenesis protein [Allosphingosinicella sp.]
MRRIPILPTLIVAAAVATMVALGIWQLGRAKEKDALRARYEANLALPAMALPPAAAVDEALRYRRASAMCLEVVGWRQTGGKSADGRTGTRHLAECRTGAEGPGFAADMGVSQDPRFRPQWRGGAVTGTIVGEPPQGGMAERMTGSGVPARPMLVSLEAAPGLVPSAQPVPDVGNSSRFYALQWFFFAAIAALIYALALRRRRRAPAQRG